MQVGPVELLVLLVLLGLVIACVIWLVLRLMRHS